MISAATVCGRALDQRMLSTWSSVGVIEVVDWQPPEDGGDGDQLTEEAVAVPNDAVYIP
jgi:hypothetical protein